MEYNLSTFRLVVYRNVYNLSINNLYIVNITRWLELLTGFYILNCFEEGLTNFSWQFFYS